MSFYKKKRYILLFVLITVLIVANSCITLRDSDRKIYKDFKKLNQKPEIYHDTYKGIPIRYIADKKFNKIYPLLFLSMALLVHLIIIINILKIRYYRKLQIW